MNDVVGMILNKNGRYEGDLIHYYKLVMKAPNAYAPYHNVRHMLHVFWESYDGAVQMGLDKRQMRNLLIAALMHDYNHTGVKNDDSVNIQRALEALSMNLLPEDLPYMDEISTMIKCTKFPYDGQEYTQDQLILRDADKSQTFSLAWVQAILYGLGKELNMSYEEMLKLQRPFLVNMKFETPWGQNKFGPLIDGRLKLVDEMINLISE